MPARAAFFDLASLTKCLVTAPLALQHLDLDTDRREALGFTERKTPLTVRQLLSHAAGLPPWLPYTGEPLSQQLRRGFPEGQHPLLKAGTPDVSLYSDLNYRLLADLLEQETGEDWRRLGEKRTGLSMSPWSTPPVLLPPGPDAEAWHMAEPHLSFPPAQPNLPHDANARQGMKGHAGFGATAPQMAQWLPVWLSQGFPQRMAVPQAHAADGRVWGLGLHGPMLDFKMCLHQIPLGLGGIHVIEQDSKEEEPVELPSPEEASRIPESGFWMHVGFTGPALFVRPEDGCIIALLLHRLDHQGKILDLIGIQKRRLATLTRFIKGNAF